MERGLLYFMTNLNLRKWRILFAVSLVSFITNVDSTIVIIGLPKIMEGLSITLVTALLVITTYIIANTVLLLPAGRWTDIMGTRSILVLGMIIFTIGTILCGISNSGIMLIICRVIQGIGAALASAPVIPIIIKTFPEEQLGLALGINSTSWVVGALVGPVIGGALISSLGWCSIFFCTVPFALICIVEALLIIKSNDDHIKSKTDWKGILTFGLGLTTVMIALSEGQSWGWNSKIVIGLFSTAFVFLAVFAVIERKVQNPLFNFKLFSYRNYTIGIGIALSYVIAYFCVTLYLTIYLQGGLSLSVMESSLLMIPLSAPQLIFGPIGGKLSDYFGTKKTIILGVILLNIGLIMLWNLDSKLSIPSIVVPLTILCIANCIAWPSLSKIVLSAIPKEETGSASGMFFTVYEFGRALSQTLAIIVIGFTLSPEIASKAIVGLADLNNLQTKGNLIFSINLGFRFFTIFFVIALILSFCLFKSKKEICDAVIEQ